MNRDEFIAYAIPHLETLMGNSLIDVELKQEDYEAVIDLSIQRYSRGRASFTSTSIRPFEASWIEEYALAQAIILLYRVYAKCDATPGRVQMFTEVLKSANQAIDRLEREITDSR